jgi:hypothetical protein
MTRCWICGGDADSWEHRQKASDIKMFNRLVEREYASKGVSVPAGLIKDPNDRAFKFNSRICEPCNNRRTQPYDQAWEKLSRHMAMRIPEYRPGEAVDVRAVFGKHVEREMLRVHLYFVKMFGGHIADLGVPIDLGKLAECLREGVPHPNIHLRLAYAPENANYIGDRNGIETVVFAKGLAAIWMYSVRRIGMTVFYEDAGAYAKPLKDYFHPGTGVKSLEIEDCEKYLGMASRFSDLPHMTVGPRPLNLRHDQAGLSV